ncbi:hypothetical protein ACS0TY_012217 [Phlomoides rotata]
MDWYALVIALLFIILGWTCFRWFLWTSPRGKLPPGPKPLPVVGNLLQLGSAPHQTLAKLSKTYGPLMSLHLGSVYTVVVSSPAMAKQIFQKHGQAFSGRHITQAIHASNHNNLSVVFIPVTNSKWRDMRKICNEKMFTKHSLEAGQGIRQEKLHQLLDYVQNCCDAGRAVDVHEASFITTLNIMSATLFSFQATEFESRATQDFKEIIQGIADIIGIANLADYFPILKPFDPQGVLRKAEYYFGKLLGKIDGYLVERLESRRNFPDALKKNDLLETLLDISEGNEYQISHDDIKHLLQDIIVGGADTNTTTIEWIMTELLLNPDKLGKLKQELKSVVGEKRLVEESDVAGLPYLQAVIKEVFRYHPPGPLLGPRAAVSDCQVDAYLIPKGTQILTNVWAIGRDPSIWANPESFEPERFLDKRTDFKGQDFELIPFGAGRRICPGIPLAERILHMTTAALVHNYDWKLEVGVDEGDHRAELFGLAVRKAVSLKAIPTLSIS